MNADTFERTLQARLGSPYNMAYRLRESADGMSWLIEQQLAPGQVVETNAKDPDIRRRMADGYGIVLKTLKAPVYKCRSCGTRQPAPVMEVREVKCAECDRLGDRSITFQGYFPLVEGLLTYIERTHPKRWEQWTAEDKAHNAADYAATDRKAHNALEAALTDDWRRLLRVPRTYLADHRTY